MRGGSPSSHPQDDAARFEIGDVIGRGAQSVVYRARDHFSGLDVAIKLSRPNDLAAGERFRSEVEVARALNGRFVGRPFATGLRNGCAYLAMPWVDGELLEATIKRAPLARDDAVALVASLADAVASLHEVGLVHGDIKPANAMRTPSGNIVLLDLGLAMRVGEEVPSTIRGTPACIAPEMLAGTSIDSAADLFAIGVIFYRLLTGVRPFGDDAASIADRFATRIVAAPPSMHRPDAAPYDAILRQTLSFDPPQRPSAVSFAASLRAIQASSPTQP